MTERSKKTDLFSEAVFARLDGVEAPDRRRWLDRDARRGLWAVGGIFAVVVLAAGLSQIMSSSTSVALPPIAGETSGVQDAFRRLSVDPADLPDSTSKPRENFEGSATSGEAGRYDSVVAAGPGQST